MTIREKRAVLEKHDKLPAYMSQGQKAERLGLNRMTMRNILNIREKIMSHKNSAMKRNRASKEAEVGEKTLEWIQAARVHNEKISISAIRRKASEIARRMGKDFSPSR